MITLIYYYRANRKIKQKSETPDNPKQLYGDKKVPMQLNPPISLDLHGYRPPGGRWKVRGLELQGVFYRGYDVHRGDTAAPRRLR